MIGTLVQGPDLSVFEALRGEYSGTATCLHWYDALKVELCFVRDTGQPVTDAGIGVYCTASRM